jgi:tetratricopeptide (TPR) repeat protein
MGNKIAEIIIVVLVGFCIFAPIVTATTAEEWNEQGCRFLESGDCEKAIECFDKAIGQNPTYTDAYLNRGLAYWYLKQDEGALVNFEKVIELDPCSDLACRAQIFALSKLEKEKGGLVIEVNVALVGFLAMAYWVLRGRGGRGLVAILQEDDPYKIFERGKT